MQTEGPSKPEILLKLGVPPEGVEYPFAGALYLEGVGGPPLSSFWNELSPDLVARQRDEFFLAGTTALAVAQLPRDIPHRNDWRLSFDVAYLFQTKPLVQAIQAINLFCTARCYSDAFSVIRTLHSRTQQLVLFSLGPHLFDEWLRNPGHEKFLDGHIRGELSNQGIYVFSHLYDQLSEVVHGQLQALSETGYFEKGLFPEIPAVANMVFVAAKFLLGVIGWVGVSAVLVDQDGVAQKPPGIEALTAIYSTMFSNVLRPARFDHLWTMLAEERHWEKAGKDKTIIAKWFQFEEYQRQLRLFHRPGQPKSLGKRYRSTLGGSA